MDKERALDEDLQKDTNFWTEICGDRLIFDTVIVHVKVESLDEEKLVVFTQSKNMFLLLNACAIDSYQGGRWSVS